MKRKTGELSKDKIMLLQRNYLMLMGRDILGMSLDDIARVFNCSSRQVVFEAIKKLKKNK